MSAGEPNTAVPLTGTRADALEALKSRYFGPAQAFDNVTEVEFLVDGDGYFADLDCEIDLVGPGDQLYVLDWFHQPSWDIRNRPPDDPDHRAIGDRLAQKCALGVDVRIILGGANYWTLTNFPPFYNEYGAVADLRTRMPPGTDRPPLADRVLFDWSGARVTGTHHQKSIVIVRSGRLVAYASGCGLNDAGVDDPPHTSHNYGDPTVSWGWHDAAVKLVGGAAVAAYRNFAERWEEASTLPPSTGWLRASTESLWPVRRVRHTQPAAPPVPAAPRIEPAASPLLGTSVQVLRSRYPAKIDPLFGRDVPWRTGGAIFEIFETLSKAISAARRYVYIEDQFLADHPVGQSRIVQWVLRHSDWLIDRRLSQFSLFPALRNAIRRDVKVILISSGHSDPRDIFPGEQNTELNWQLADLAAANPSRLAVWRIPFVTIHSKLVVIDDEFAAVGSANLAARSMMGVDSELQVAVVTTGSAVRRLRVRLWADHLGLDPDNLPPAVAAALYDEADALGMWRTGWGAPGRWFVPDDPPGFEPAVLVPGEPRTRSVRAYVGPGVTP